MDIAAMSVAMSTTKVQQAASLAMTKKTMELQESSAANLIQMMMQNQPSFGHRLDVRA